MGSRKTAYIATIESVSSIEGKDRIKYITLKDLGWRIIGSAHLQAGQKVIYIEYDTVIKGSWAQSLSELFRQRTWNSKYMGYRITAMKMAGVVSYGIIFTPEECEHLQQFMDKEEGADLSEELQIYALEECTEIGGGSHSKAYPAYIIQKTDEVRVELLKKHLPQFKGKHVYVSVKIDGQSATYIHHKGRFIICSRGQVQYNEELDKAREALIDAHRYKTDNQFLYIACKYNIPLQIPPERAIQGELAGPGIQKNRLNLKDYALYLFNYYNTDLHKYYDLSNLKTFSSESGIPMVPIVHDDILFTWDSIEGLKALAKGSYDSGYPREGIVIRSVGENGLLEEPFQEMYNLWSFKVINDDYVAKGLK